MTNAMLISEGLGFMRPIIASFACSRLEAEFGKPGQDWWLDGVVGSLVTKNRRTADDVIRFSKLPESIETVSGGTEALDVLNCLILIKKHASRFFGKGTDAAYETQRFAQELIGVRHQYAHQTRTSSIEKSSSGDFASDYAWRAIDTMNRLVHHIDPNAVGMLLTIRSQVDLSEYGQGVVASTDAISAAEINRAETVELSGGQSGEGPDFSSQDLRHMDFANANLEGADFSGADLRGADFSGANLRNAILVKPRMADQYPSSAVDLSGADLTGAKIDLRAMDLRHMDFANANLEGADFSGADLRGADFSGANLRNAILVKPRMADQYPSSAVDISGADLTGTTLNFRDTDLRHVDLSGHDFSGVDFTGADLRHADLSSAVLDRDALKRARVSDQYPSSAAILSNVTWV